MPQGPYDDATLAPRSATIEVSEPEAVAAERPPLPGGKALLRLLQLLETSGYTETANATIEAVVPTEDTASVREMVAQFVPTPDGEAPGASADARRRTRRGRASETTEATDTDAGEQQTEAIASMYLEVGEQLGPPTATGPQWRSVGPSTITNGQTYGTSRVNVSGRV